VLVRLIYTIEDPNRPGHRVEHRLITSLLDPERAGAEELVVAYHSRWEFELATDEIKSHQRSPDTPLRSKKALGVIQEIYGLLIAHYVVRTVMVEAAKKAELAPSRLSFTNTLRLIREVIPEAQRTAKADHPRLYRPLLEDVAATPWHRERTAAIHGWSNARCPNSVSRVRPTDVGLSQPSPSERRSFSLTKPYCL
jgi:hypothetical protein